MTNENEDKKKKTAFQIHAENKNSGKRPKFYPIKKVNWKWVFLLVITLAVTPMLIGVIMSACNEIEKAPQREAIESLVTDFDDKIVGSKVVIECDENDPNCPPKVESLPKIKTRDKYDFLTKKIPEKEKLQRILRQSHRYKEEIQVLKREIQLLQTTNESITKDRQDLVIQVNNLRQILKDRTVEKILEKPVEKIKVIDKCKYWDSWVNEFFKTKAYHDSSWLFYFGVKNKLPMCARVNKKTGKYYQVPCQTTENFIDLQR